MSEVFSTRKKLLAGESFAVEWLPGSGTVISVNGKPEGAPVKEPEFYSALMKIWLGKSPADPQLKDALLGKGSGPSKQVAQQQAAQAALDYYAKREKTD